VNDAWLVRLGGVLLVSAWGVTVVAGWTALTRRWVAGWPAASRYRVALGALVAAATMPAVLWAAVPTPDVAWLRWLALAWLTGVTVAMLRLGRGLYHVQRLRRRARPVTGAAQTRLTALAQTLGLGRAVVLAESDDVEVPCTIGLLAPAVLVPPPLLAHDDPVVLHAVCAHELAHVARHDYAWHLVQLSAGTLTFHHPAAWWLSAVVDREREAACDARASALVAPVALAQALAGLERERPGARARTARHQPLLERVSQLVEPAVPERSTAWHRAAALRVVASGFVAFPLLWLGIALATHLPDGSSAVWSTAVGVGLVVGLRHAFEPDHLMAVATMVTRERSAAEAVRLGASWGLGHTASLLALVALLSAARGTMPEALGTLVEVGVAAMILWMGVQALRDARRMAARGPIEHHRHGLVAHRHAAGADHVHLGSLALARRPLGVGLVHGLAGSGALTAAATSALPGLPEQLIFVLLFGLGSTAGMAVVSGLAGWPLERLVASPRTMTGLSAVTGLAAVAFALVWGAPLAAGLFM